MPDITMCCNDICHLKSRCYRHFASGTLPDKYQSFTIFKLNKDNNCDFFWNKKDFINDYNDKDLDKLLYD